MRISLVAVLCSAIIGPMAISSPALAAAKTAKECQQEWRANKAANEAKKITEKDYVAKCRAELIPAKEEKTTKQTAAPAGTAKKTKKQCQQEWRANEAANKAKGVTEQAYVATCESGAITAAPAAARVPASPPVAAPKEKATAPIAPAPATATPVGANQFASEAQAKARCGSGTVVWSNLESKIYHFAGHNDYGHTKSGAYMCETDAMTQGMRAAKNEKHP